MYSASSTDNATFYHFKTSLDDKCTVVYQSGSDFIFGYGGDNGENKLFEVKNFKGLMLVVSKGARVNSFDVTYPEDISAVIK